MLIDLEFSKDELKEIKVEKFVALVSEKARDFYEKKEEMLGVEFMARLEQVAILQNNR